MLSLKMLPSSCLSHENLNLGQGDKSYPVCELISLCAMSPTSLLK